MIKHMGPKRVVHLKGPHPDKGVCDKRGIRTRHEADVTCPECRAMLHRADSILEAMHKMVRP